MSHGIVKTNDTKPHFGVNKKGFISIYAMMILQIILLFLSFVTQSVLSFTKIHTTQKQDLVDVAILHNVQESIQKQQPIVTEESEEIPQHEEAKGPIEEEPQNKEWDLIYQGITFYFHQENDKILVQFLLSDQEKKVEITLDETASHIMNYEYVS